MWCMGKIHYASVEGSLKSFLTSVAVVLLSRFTEGNTSPG